MNIFKKLINWLIHILGGYTEEEYNTAEEPWFELAKEYYNKYTAEHKAYLALLNCHNATAEAKMDALTMARGIKACCVATDDCSECRLAGENGKCNVDEIPCYWEVAE